MMQQEQGTGISAFQRSWLDLKMALAVCHAAEECETQVAHWIFEGRAGFPALLDIRQQVKIARKARSKARARYLRHSSLAADESGRLAALGHQSLLGS